MMNPVKDENLKGMIKEGKGEGRTHPTIQYAIVIINAPSIEKIMRYDAI